MAEQPMPLTDEERNFLTGLLEFTLHDTRVEEHRTRSPAYRQHILHREELVSGLLRKLKEPAVA